MDIRVKRVYEPADDGDGTRVLVDRVWPRGVAKATLRADMWLKEIAPTTALRQWFGHDPARWEGFRDRYFAELDSAPEPVSTLRDLARKGTVTLLYSARDEQHNQAVALREYLLSERGGNHGA